MPIWVSVTSDSVLYVPDCAAVLPNSDASSSSCFKVVAGRPRDGWDFSKGTSFVHRK